MQYPEPIQRHTVLCVDDDPQILEQLSRLLRRDGHDVITAASGDEGLRQLQAHDVALILSNQTMPGMVGTRFLEESREVAPDAVRIMLTSHTDADTALDAINGGGIHRYLLKPWDDDQLRMTVQEHLRTYAAQRQTEALLRELREKNEQLERFNADLEMLVVERSKELFYRVRELEARDRLARFMMTVHSLEDTLDHLATVVGETLDAHFVEVRLVGDDGDETPKATWPAHAVPVDAEDGTPLIQRAVSEEGAVFEHEDNRYVCATPVVRDGSSLAAVLLRGRGSEEAAAEIARILQGIALAAAVVVHEALEGYDVGGWRDALDDALRRVDDLVD